MKLFDRSVRKLPLILQDASGECGLACIAMVAQWHGHKLDLSYLRANFPTTREGLSMAALTRVARHLNFDARGLHLGDLSDLALLKLPAILHWDNNHFVVLRRVSRRGFTIHNPAAGVRIFTSREVQEHFSGYALELAAADTFAAIVQSKKYPLRQILSTIDGLGRSTVQVVAITVAGSILAMLLPMAIQIALDSVLPKGDLDLLLVLSVGVGLVSVAHAFSDWLHKRIVLNAGNAFYAQMTRNAVGHIVKLPLKYFESRHPGDIVTRLESIENLKSVLTESLINALVDMTMLILSGILMFVYVPSLAAIVSSIFLAVVAIRLFLYPSIRRQGTLALKAKSEERSQLIDQIRAISALKSSNSLEDVSTRWYASLIKYVNARFRAGEIETTAVLIVDIATAFGTAITLYLGIKAVMGQLVTVGMLYAFLTYRTMFFDRIDKLIVSMTNVAMLGNNMGRLSDFLEESKEHLGAHVERRIRSKVELRDAGYRPGFSTAPIVGGVDLEIPFRSGSLIAVTGPSGAGKTTLLKLIAGLYLPTEGQLLVDGMHLPVWGLAAYRENVGVVLGSDRVVRGSVAENVASFSANSDRDAIRASLSTACLEDVVASLPRQDETTVSEENGVLSSGQRRRLMLARALYGDPGLLLLDEITSNLDAATSRLLLRNIKALDATKVIATHDPEVLAIADTVLIIRDGKLFAEETMSGMMENSCG